MAQAMLKRKGRGRMMQNGGNRSVHVAGLGSLNKARQTFLAMAHAPSSRRGNNALGGVVLDVLTQKVAPSPLTAPRGEGSDHGHDTGPPGGATAELQQRAASARRASVARQPAGAFGSGGDGANSAPSRSFNAGKRRNSVDSYASHHVVYDIDGRKPRPMSRWQVNPDARAKIAWDMLVGAFICYSVMIIPWRLSFDVDAVAPVLYFDYAVDVSFGIDMALSCITCYWCNNAMAERYLETHASRILDTYLRTWFFPDLISTVPIDLIVEAAVGRAGAGGLRSVKLVRTVRLFRLFKLMRLMRLGRKMSAFDLREHVNPAVFSLLKVLARILFISHLIACFWAMVNDCKNDEIRAYEAELTYDRMGAVEAFGNGKVYTEKRARGMLARCGDGELTSQYIASLYWTIGTMMSVGYGDISGQSDVERLYCILTQIIGAAAFGFIIATVTIMVETSDPQAGLRDRHLAEVRAYVAEMAFPKPLRKKLMQQVNHYYKQVSVFRDLGIIQQLPSQLRARVMHAADLELANCFALFRRMEGEKALVGQLIVKLHPMIMHVGDRIEMNRVTAQAVYFVARGELLGFAEAELDDPAAAHPAAAPGDGEAEEEVPPGLADPKKLVTPVLHCVLHEGCDCELDSVVERTGMQFDYTATTVSDVYWLEQTDLFFIMMEHPGSSDAIADVVGERLEVIEAVMATTTVWKEVFPGKPPVLAKECVSYNHRITEVDAVCGDIARGHAAPGGLTATRLRTRRIKVAPSSQSGATAAALGSPAKAGGGGGGGGGGLRSKSSPVGPLPTAVLSSVVPEPLFAATGGSDAVAAGELEEAVENERALRNRFILYHADPGKIHWDMWIGVLVAASLILVPYRLGFSRPNPDTDDLWAFADWFVDGMFALDLVASFRTSYVDNRQLTVTVPSMIASRYLRGWFTIDFLSTVPFDKIFEHAFPDAGSGQLRSLKLIRILRLFRLFKLARLATAAIDTDGDSNIDFGPLTITPRVTHAMSLTGVLLFVAHLFGSFWSYVAIDGESTGTWWEAAGIEPDEERKRYIAALYWAFTTMTTVGYGDIIPTNDKERIFTMVIMLLGATVFGYVVGSVSSLVDDDTSNTARSEEKIQHLIHYLNEKNLEKGLRQKVKEAAGFVLAEQAALDPQVLQHLPHDLRRETVLHARVVVIRKFDELARMERKLLAALVELMRAVQVTAGDWLYTPYAGSTGAFFLLSGTVSEHEPDLDGHARVEHGPGKYGYLDAPESFGFKTVSVFKSGDTCGLAPLLNGAASVHVSRRAPPLASPAPGSTGVAAEPSGSYDFSFAPDVRGARAIEDATMHVIEYAALQTVASMNPRLGFALIAALRGSFGVATGAAEVDDGGRVSVSPVFGKTAKL